MYRKLGLVTGLFVAALTITPLAVSAATTAPLTSVAQTANAHLQFVQYGGWRDRDRDWRGPDRGWRDDGGWRYCQAWRHRCAERWGWGGWEFRRCLWRHGCGGRYRNY